MKRTIALFLSLALVLCLNPGAHAESTAHLIDYADDSPGTLGLIFFVADCALADGMDPEQVRTEMAELAEEAGLGEALSYAAENIAAEDSDSYWALIGREEAADGNFSIWIPQAHETAVLDAAGFTAYGTPGVSDALKELLADPGAQYCTEPSLWTQREFQQYFGTSYCNFRPSSPRPGYVCLVLAENAQSWPETRWTDEDAYNRSALLNAAEDTARMLLNALSEAGCAPVITGNPNLASSFWIFDAQYSMRGWYGDMEIRGFNSSFTVTAADAVTKAQTASVTRQTTLPDRISSWHDWVAAANLFTPDDSDQDVQTMVRNIGAAITRERNSASADRKLTALNAASVLGGILANRADQTQDAWQKAIYNAGPRDIELGSETIRFSLRSFEADTVSAGTYSEAADQTAWLMNALAGTQRWNVCVELPLSEGRLTQAALYTLSNTVSQAALKASQSFISPDMQAAILDHFCPAPQQIESWMTEHPELAENASAAAWTALFGSISGRYLNTWTGPHSLSLTFTGIRTDRLLDAAFTAAADSQAYVSADRRCYDELDALFGEQLTSSAASLRWAAAQQQTIAIDIDDLLSGLLPTAYTDYITGFDTLSSLTRLRTLVDGLPEQAASEFPYTCMLSGSYSGVPVTFSISADNEATYIQLRNTASDTAVSSAFIRAGSAQTLYVPAGEYRIVYCSGPYWYGEEQLFAGNGSYNKSEPTELESGYNYSFTLEPVTDGDISLYSASPEDFR